MNDVKHCPFCGSTKLKADSKKINRPRYLTGDKWEDGHTGSMRCNRCHARGPTVTVWVPRHTLTGIQERIKDAAIEAWNRRAELPAWEEGKR
jgi:Lar family restriction alleviation protein